MQILRLYSCVKLRVSMFYRFLLLVQSIQENEDELDVDVGPAPEISDLLGAEYEHLYPKILYLVMADSAYCEGKFSVIDFPCKHDDRRHL